LLESINRTLEGWVYLPLLYSHFVFLRLGVCHEQISIPIIKRGTEGGDLRGYMESCSVFMDKVSDLGFVPHFVLCLMCAGFRSERL
jgi:hypothetical protein